MYKVTVLYGQPTNPAAFEQHYYGTHLPLCAKMQGIKGFTIGKLGALEPGQQSPYYRVASLYVDSPAALHATLTSPEGQAVVGDIANFATGGVTLMVSEEEVLVPIAIK